MQKWWMSVVRMRRGTRGPLRSLATLLVLIAVVPGAAAIATAGRGADGEYEERRSSHFVLYQDVDIDRTSGFYGSRRFEKQVLDVLEGAYRRLEAAIGLRPRDAIVVTIHDPDVFAERFTGLFRFPAAGFYGGTIHVRGDTQVTNALIRVLHHELVHAAFDQALPRVALPAWFNEGVAEWFEARALGLHHLVPGQKRVLRQIASQEQLFSLAQLSSRALGHLAPRDAQLAYLQSHAFIDYLASVRGDRRLRDLCRRVARTGDLADAVRRIYRGDVSRLEEDFATALRRGSY
ncbi:MAG: peptidase MA family metallohydrolase [Myxococcota bacterium]|jgi:hypothetical protein|nr:peptidase MA family metallohydrolase [Myxococcota bacterium]